MLLYGFVARPYCIHPLSCMHNLFVFPKTDSIVNILRCQLNQMHAIFNHWYIYGWRERETFFVLKKIISCNQSKYVNWDSRGFCLPKLSWWYSIFSRYSFFFETHTILVVIESRRMPTGLVFSPLCFSRSPVDNAEKIFWNPKTKTKPEKDTTENLLFVQFIWLDDQIIAECNRKFTVGNGD